MGFSQGSVTWWTNTTYATAIHLQTSTNRWTLRDFTSNNSNTCNLNHAQPHRLGWVGFYLRLVRATNFKECSVDPPPLRCLFSLMHGTPPPPCAASCLSDHACWWPDPLPAGQARSSPFATSRRSAHAVPICYACRPQSHYLEYLQHRPRL